MKRLILSFLTGLLAFGAMAQTKSLEFFYIAHDRSTPVSVLSKRLKDVYQNAIYDEEMATIFYFPNADNPIVVRINLPDDNRSRFEEILAELRTKPHHDIYADMDFKHILNLFNKYDFVDENGQQNYSSVLLCWYVNPEFWMLKYHEQLIASLHFNLELEKYQNFVSTEIWHGEGDGIEQYVDFEHPFGSKNLCPGLPFMLLQY